MSYYKTSTDYHDALDRREAQERAERAQREYEAEQREKADQEAERIEIGSILEWLAPAELTPDLQIVTSVQPVPPRSRMLIESGAVDENGNLKPYKVSRSNRPMTLEELGDDGQDYGSW